MRHCFDCSHIQPKHTGYVFKTICDKFKKKQSPGAKACKAFTPDGGKKQKRKIHSKILRPFCKGLEDWSFYPLNQDEEISFAGMLDKIHKVMTDFARAEAIKAASTIGED